MSPLLDKLLVFIHRELATMARYRAGLGMDVIILATEIAGFFFLARAIGPAFQPEGYNYFPYLLVGTAVYGFLITGSNAFVNSIRDSQVTGTIEILMSTSTRPLLIAFLLATPAFLARALYAAIYLVVGFALLTQLPANANWWSVIVLVTLAAVVAFAFGMFAAAVQVAVHRGGVVVWFVGATTWLLTGTTYPVESLPPFLRQIGAVLPITHAISGLREALLRGTPPSGLSDSILVLALYAAVGLPVSLAVFARVVRYARRAGSLGFF